VVLAALCFTVRLHGVHSLKDKRRPRQQLVERIRNAHRVAVAEVADQDTWDLLTLGVAVVGPDAVIVGTVLDRVMDLVNDEGFRVEREERRLDRWKA
jgi:uncharacterized protein YlxP (DUF503 family)